ncbi:MAG: hypothetical protein A4E31_00116 [Methanomassiliicoccales archaeon PtaU1.Bin030]|nr:MAG: hypothetical protein A4E31_00116 [Methanomassiliicoccales archaeon PtaU1.Bin030]
MKLREAVCRNLCLNSSESLIALIRTSSSIVERTMPSSPLSSMRLGEETMKVSSVTVTETFPPICWVSMNAYARERASLTRRPKGKWKMTLWLPLMSMYPSIASSLSLGMKSQAAFCSRKYERMERAEPWSIPKEHSHSIISTSSRPSLCISSRRKTAMFIDRSKERGRSSPLHVGTVGLRPAASLTNAFMPLVLTYSYDFPPRTKTSRGESLSTNFSVRSPMSPPFSVNTL